MSSYCTDSPVHAVASKAVKSLNRISRYSKWNNFYVFNNKLLHFIIQDSLYKIPTQSGKLCQLLGKGFVVSSVT